MRRFVASSVLRATFVEPPQLNQPHSIPFPTKFTANSYDFNRYLDVQRKADECHGHGCRGYRRPRAWRRPGQSACVQQANVVSPHFQDFERKSALFSLASSEILIVNLWEHQVGLYQGANMGLLKTVFEVNLGLFGKKAVDG